MDDYRKFLRIKSLPAYSFVGRTAIFPDEYAEMVAGDGSDVLSRFVNYEPSDFLFDYQRAIAQMAISKRKFAIFADCGLGKTLIYAEFIRYADIVLPADRQILIISPLMVIDQTLAEFQRFYGDSIGARIKGEQPIIEKVPASGLKEWLKTGGRIGITNFEAFSGEEIKARMHRLGCVVIDESSMLKSHYGKWGQQILRLGKGVPFKLCGTGTPAPNDRIEYANHAVFLDAFPNVNAFLARYFVNRGQTQERWVLKPHAIRPFYRALSHWCIFLTNPATYGWRDHSDDIPPIHVKIHQVPLTDEQRDAIQDETGQLIPTSTGGIGQRSKLGQISKGRLNGKRIKTNKTDYMRELIASWPDESTIIWCLYNDEQAQVAEAFPEAANISGATPMAERAALVDAFKSGKTKILITKPKILGFGLNLQIATRQVFSGLQDSYESFYQAVKRSNRVGSTRPLNVHIPVTDAERPMIETVLSKSARVQADAEQQEAIFHENAIGLG